MHPELIKFPNKTFYEGQLENGVSRRDRKSHKKFKWPNPNVPMFFYNIKGFYERKALTSKSYFNKKEAKILVKIVIKLLNAKIKPETIGIITPYNAQKKKI